MKFEDISLLPDDDKPESIRRWRIRLAVVACSAWLSMAFFVFPALIGLPFALPKFGTVAWASDVQQTRNDLTDIKASLLSQSILSARKEQCEAIEEGRAPRYWTEQLLELKDQYYKLTGRSFEIPRTCDEI